MELKKVNEKILKPASGMLMLFLLILAEFASLIVMINGIVYEETLGALIPLSILLMTLFSIMFAGLRTVRPNEALVLTLFGKYHGTINKAGFFYVNPFSVGFNPAYEEYKEDAARKARTSGQKGQESVTVTPVKKPFR